MVEDSGLTPLKLTSIVLQKWSNVSICTGLRGDFPALLTRTLYHMLEVSTQDGSITYSIGPMSFRMLSKVDFTRDPSVTSQA